ncbi:MAG: PAS domain-containing protein [SAR324 cluster bacterium]|nr:PAS domain-containing protein [SAR324 cluster bacterium]
MDKKTENTPSHYVGVGASAGGLEAIEEFFKDMPTDSGLAFIVIQHLSPDYKSLMKELLSKRTKMSVYRTEEGMLVEPNNIYLIPPKKNLKIFHGKLLLSEQDHSQGLNLPIDVFLRSLADDQGERAISIILSGTGSDGTRGTRAIKECGGMVMVQSEESAKFDGMPRSAIATGLADFILAPSEMPEQLLSFIKHPYATKSEFSEGLLTNEDGLTRIFSLLREKHKVDFTYYKPSTIIRRIERRMTVNQIHELQDYVKYMESYPREISSLYRELLIGVTNFFRDDEAFNTLKERWIPELLERGEKREIRLWTAGCSSGEEAYSLAILFRECMEDMGRSFNVKIFATDVDRNAIERSSNGAYPESIAADMSPKLLSRYFQRKDDTFYVTRSIREMVVFAQHNLIKDPPFTNIDLVSCRNLLIYLQPVLQKKALELFNFALNPQGILFLGTSETTGEMSEYFEALDHKWKLYLCKGRRSMSLGNQAVAAPLDVTTRMEYTRYPHRRNILRMHEEERLLERLIQGVSVDYLPLTLVTNEQMELLHTVGDTSDYFKLPAGKMHNDLSKMALKELTIPLATGIQKVFKTREETNYSNIRISRNDVIKVLKMRIVPLPDKKGQDPLAGIFIEEEQPMKIVRNDMETGFSYDVTKEAEQRIQDLEQELQFNRENLQATIEELETSNEELQATNEELLASNEELQSTNEELQSVNEELYTVNAEHQRKIMEYSELNHDVDNLLKGTQIATLFLDENLEIRKFTPQLSEIYQIIDSDVERPFHHLTHNLVGEDPLALVHSVQRSSEAVKQEVQNSEGRWFLMRVLPYYVAPKTYSGIVMTFVDITDRKRMEEDLYLANVAFESQAAAMITDKNGSIVRVNQTFANLHGYSKEELIGKNPRVFKSGRHDESFYQQMWTSLLETDEWEGNIWNRHKNGNMCLEKLRIMKALNDKQEITHYIGHYLEVLERERSQ